MSEASHDEQIILDLEAMASNSAAGFWPQMLAIGALRLIRERDICPMCEKHIAEQDDVPVPADEGEKK